MNEESCHIPESDQLIRRISLHLLEDLSNTRSSERVSQYSLETSDGAMNRSRFTVGAKSNPPESKSAFTSDKDGPDYSTINDQLTIEMVDDQFSSRHFILCGVRV